MQTAAYTPIDEEFETNNPFFPYFFENDKYAPRPVLTEDCYYKIYHDGGSFIATKCFKSQSARKNKGHKKEEIDYMFDSLYATAMQSGLTGKRSDRALTEFLKNGLMPLFPELENADEFIEKKIKAKRHNLAVRKKRFRRKAHLNCWNYFITLTYDDKKQTAESFREKLRKCLSNLHTRRGWRYMGVFERAPETGRLHFHGLIYVPCGEMIGNIEEKKDYSTAQGKMQTYRENDFFLEAFGRNDFTPLGEMQLKYGRTVDYIVKYIGKTNERICYSRGIPTVICKKLSEENIITAYKDYVEKYILFDNVIDWERDILRRTKYSQIRVIDVLCNPPRVA